MTTLNPNEAASPLAADNLQASGERPVDVAEVPAPASNRDPEMQDLAHTHSDQVVDVESAEDLVADTVQLALAIDFPPEIDSPSTEDNGEPSIDLVNLTLAELMELKVILKDYSSHGPSVDLTTRSLAQLMRTKVLSGNPSDTKPPADLLVHGLDDLLGIEVMSGGSTSFDRPSLNDLIAMSLSELQGVRVGGDYYSDPPPVIIAQSGGANFTPFESISDLAMSRAGASTATSPLGDITASSSSTPPRVHRRLLSIPPGATTARSLRSTTPPPPTPSRPAA